MAAGAPLAAVPTTTELLTIDEAAARLRMSRRSLYRMVAAGDAPHRRTKGIRGVRFTEADLVAIVEAAARPAVARRPTGPRRRAS